MTLTITLGGIADKLDRFIKDRLGVQALTLWDNASPNSAFPAQKIDLDLSEYGYIAQELKASATVNWRNTTILTKSNGAEAAAFVQSNIPAFREITITDTGISFSTGQYYSSYGGTSTNKSTANAIPTKIYGIKGIMPPLNN